MNGCSVLTPTKSGNCRPDGHEKSLGGTQASGAGESHAQQANVAEISYGEPVIGKPEYPERVQTPGGERVGKTRPTNAPDKQVTNGVFGSESAESSLPADPYLLRRVAGVHGNLKDHSSKR
jgi:hypothetical protein